MSALVERSKFSVAVAYAVVTGGLLYVGGGVSLRQELQRHLLRDSPVRRVRRGDARAPASLPGFLLHEVFESLVAGEMRVAPDWPWYLRIGLPRFEIRDLPFHITRLGRSPDYGFRSEGGRAGVTAACARSCVLPVAGLSAAADMRQPTESIRVISCRHRRSALADIRSAVADIG